MTGGRFAAWFGGAARRLAGVPWSEISSDVLGRAFLVVKVACLTHIFDKYVCGFAMVRGPSMLPTMNPEGDFVLVDRVTTQCGLIGVGDVVLVRSPENPRKIVTKRVLGLEGDAVTFLVDPLRDGRSRTVVVPEGHIWVQGDNIYDSRDSRQFGPVPYGLLQGRVFCRECCNCCGGPTCSGMCYLL